MWVVYLSLVMHLIHEVLARSNHTMLIGHGVITLLTGHGAMTLLIGHGAGMNHNASIIKLMS